MRNRKIYLGERGWMDGSIPVNIRKIWLTSQGLEETGNSRGLTLGCFHGKSASRRSKDAGEITLYKWSKYWMYQPKSLPVRDRGQASVHLQLHRVWLVMGLTGHRSLSSHLDEDVSFLSSVRSAQEDSQDLGLSQRGAYFCVAQTPPLWQKVKRN